MTILFDWTYRDGALFTYREPSPVGPGEGRLFLSSGNNVELILGYHEIFQPVAKEFCSDELWNSYKLRWDNEPPSDDIEGQITFDTLSL